MSEQILAQPKQELHSQDHQQEDWRSPEALARRRRLRDVTRNYYKQLATSLASPALSACAWLLPWPAQNYPGRIRGIRQALGDRVGHAAIDRWRYAKSPVPLWALERLLVLVSERLRVGREIEGRLMEAIAERKARKRKPFGLEIIDEATGLPKYRNRVGRRRSGNDVAPAERKGERRV